MEEYSGNVLLCACTLTPFPSRLLLVIPGGRIATRVDLCVVCWCCVASQTGVSVLTVYWVCALEAGALSQRWKRWILEDQPTHSTFNDDPALAFLFFCLKSKENTGYFGKNDFSLFTSNLFALCSTVNTVSCIKLLYSTVIIKCLEVLNSEPLCEC